MGKQIHTTFESREAAEAAERYLREQGFEHVSTIRNQTITETTDEDWIAAYEIAHSLGGEVASDAFETEAYRIMDTLEESVDDPPIPEEEMDANLVDSRAYVDANFGYGDYELVEPYILHRYHQRANEYEWETPDKGAP